ncbi:MAG: hypothetical protein Q7R33_05165 [Nitrosarchaeum sp.]|nr:hypothetical protein [Nitrosarchaeum sp.]
MFIKHGSVFAITDVSIIKTASEWTEIANKVSTAEGIKIHKNLDPTNEQKVVCEIDLNNNIYIHTTIMASIDLEEGSDYYITRATEKYINTNGDSWPRAELIKDYKTFVTSGTIYVEHDQHPERAKGKVLDAIARDMGDTVLVDLLFCVDRRHADLVHNIETGIANAVSMGCTTKYTICSICGNVAHDEKEYCNHVKNNKNQMIRCADSVYRKACELCFENTFYDCSIVANPAFAGAVFRKLVAADKVASQLLSNVLCRKISSTDYQNEILKIASADKIAVSHPIDRKDKTDTDYQPTDEYADIPYRDPHNTLKKFDEQQSESVIMIGKKAACNGYGSLVILNDKYMIPSQDRVANTVFNFITKNTVGRLVGKDANSCAIYFAKYGMIRNIPSNIVSPFIQRSNDNVGIGNTPNGGRIDITKQAKQFSDEDLSIMRKGTYLPTGDRFQILRGEDDIIEVRWLDGPKMGTKEELKLKEITEKNVKWASIINNLVSFDANWTGKQYHVRAAKWNEKYASLLDKFESHIDNVQHDITSVTPTTKGQRYSKSFTIKTKFGNTLFKFNANVNTDNLRIDVNSISW